LVIVEDHERTWKRPLDITVPVIGSAIV